MSRSTSAGAGIPESYVNSESSNQAASVPCVAIVGRPNAGKSTLFNRLAGRRKAVVHSTPGVTRDLNREIIRWEGRSLVLIDTGGLDLQSAPSQQLDEAVRRQTIEAVQQADLVICLFDGRAGWSPLDAETVTLLRHTQAKVVWAVNKVDTLVHEARLGEFYRCGITDLAAISAEHGRGIDELMTRVVAAAPHPPAEPQAGSPLAISIIGRPNVGKSSLLNRLVGSQRVIVDATAGTTRDAIDTPFTWEGRDYLLVDTAGIRRRPKIGPGLEQLFVRKAMKALQRSQIALVVFDATEGITAQDVRLCNMAWRHGRGLVVVVNKCDLTEIDVATARETLSQRYPSLASVPLLCVSATEGSGVSNLMPTVHRVAEAHSAKIETRILNRLLGEWTQAHEPPVYQGRRVKFFYAVQVASQPPSIAIFCNYPAGVKSSYSRYLEKKVSEAFALKGTPLRLRFRRRR